ncbi:MAG: hypothetical protein PHE59_02140 [Patescibacteria group bacterium]|nr:hypothetical protein [Patescibacteria group bacterium]MDD5164749.1 hypothetical protein [Patescibacteria group bacterium]MDD5534582.1 hypothetical protein [Patescibacteria group bacterium]
MEIKKDRIIAGCSPSFEDTDEEVEVKAIWEILPLVLDINLSEDINILKKVDIWSLIIHRISDDTNIDLPVLEVNREEDEEVFLRDGRFCAYSFKDNKLCTNAIFRNIKDLDIKLFNGNEHVCVLIFPELDLALEYTNIIIIRCPWGKTFMDFPNVCESIEKWIKQFGKK